MKKKKVKNKFNISNKLAYTLMVVLSIVLVGMGVYASLTPGVAPNPGHTLDTIAPPSPCLANSFQYWNGTDWKCKPIGICGAGTVLTWTSSNAFSCVTNFPTPPTCTSTQVLTWTGSAFSCVTNVQITSDGIIAPSDIKLTTATHNGRFVLNYDNEGYTYMKQWINNNGCSGYHVCTVDEVLKYLQTLPLNDPFFNELSPGVTGVSGFYWAVGGNNGNDDCKGWHSVNAIHFGSAFYYETGNYDTKLDLFYPSSSECDDARYVLCCK